MIQELRLPFVADLHDRYVSEARFPELLNCLNGCVKIRTARNLLGNVFGPDEGARTFEPPPESEDPRSLPSRRRRGVTHQVSVEAHRCCPDYWGVVRVLRHAGDGRETVSPESYIECVFENDLVELDAAGTLATAEANEHTLITAETRRLQIANHWADLHPGDAVPKSRLPGTERPAQLGGDGTPTVGDFAPAELGCVLRMSDGSASRLIGDALDLRHRLPSIWTASPGRAGAGLPGPPHR